MHIVDHNMLSQYPHQSTVYTPMLTIPLLFFLLTHLSSQHHIGRHASSRKRCDSSVSNGANITNHAGKRLDPPCFLMKCLSVPQGVSASSRSIYTFVASLKALVHVQTSQIMQVKILSSTSTPRHSLNPLDPQDAGYQHILPIYLLIYSLITVCSDRTVVEILLIHAFNALLLLLSSL